MLNSEEDICKLIQEDEKMMNVLRAAKSLELPDWWICAGFVRSKIWDTLHHFKDRTDTPDVDVIYYDQENIDKLKRIFPNIPWSVKNEARMHLKNNLPPYSSSVDAISKFPETATALGVKLDGNDKVILTAPCGIKDVINLEVRPTLFFTESKDRAAIYEERIHKKNWKSIWHKVKVYHLATEGSRE
ncbi:nucleotidyltransferase family protein [Robertmurraya korlensis]|uniref:nucleotidyltransferase family protein n=1 Tax=Robertmurraya korlensis TaxID=519977 RepID=UPI000825A124|nr:nucleotidyltransferase family protein [Robertmurraya korlensis]